MFCTSTVECNSTDLHSYFLQSGLVKSIYLSIIQLYAKDIKQCNCKLKKKKKLEIESSVLATYYLCRCCRARTFPGPLPFWVGTRGGHLSGCPVSVLWGFVRSTRPSCPQRPPPPRRRRCSQNSILNSTARAANIFGLPCLNPKSAV